MRRINRTIASMITGLVIISCTGFEELNDPNEFAAYSIEMNEVKVPMSSLEIPLSASLEVGSSTNGSGAFVLSNSSDMSNAVEIEATRAGGVLTASSVLHGYGETFYVKALFKGGRNVMESSITSFSLLQFEDYVSIDTPKCTSVNTSGATVSTSVNASEGILLNASGFELSSSSEPFQPTGSVAVKINNGHFSASFTNLEPAKTYYVRAYVKDGENIAYSERVSFTTEAELPSLDAPVTSNVTKNSALVTTNLASNGGAEVSELGVVYSLTKSPTVASAKVKASSTDTGIFSVNITGLDPGKTYFARAYAVNSVGTAYSSEVSFTTGLDEAKLTTSSVSGITSNSAVCGGSISSDGGAPVTARGVVWSTSQNPTVSLSSKTINGSGTGQFTSTITGLKPATTYYVRAYATTLAGTAYGNEVSFTTNASSPIVSTLAITEITARTATAGGRISDDGGSAVTARGIVWGTSQYPTVSLPTITDNGAGIGVYNASLTGLEPGVTYYVRAYATNSIGTSYGEQISFKTQIELPTVTTKEVSAVTASSAASGGEVTSDGGSPVIARGVVWSKSDNPNVNLTTKTSDGTGKGNYTSMLSNLEPGVKYYVRAYATNAAGTAYGMQYSFTTDCSSPTVVTSQVNNITAHTATSGGVVKSDGGSPITARGVVWSTTASPTISLTTKTADGSGSGSFESAMTELKPKCIYYVRAYATNSVGTSYGDEISFMTTAEMIDGYECVDLGLPSGLKWATCNVGASKPEDIGGYYQWAGTTDVTKLSIDLDWSHCPYHNSSDWEFGWSKYILSSMPSGSWTSSGPDNKSTLDPEDDAAHIIMKGSWRMPTKSEWYELLQQCFYAWTDDYQRTNVPGVILTSKITGFTDKHIFLPAAGFRTYRELRADGSSCYYWTSELYSKTSHPESAAAMWGDRTSNGASSQQRRYYGIPVRAVSE